MSQTLTALLMRYRDDDDDLGDAPRITFSDAIRRRDDPMRVPCYPAGLDLVACMFDDLPMIGGDDTDEEMHRFGLTGSVGQRQPVVGARALTAGRVRPAQQPH